MATNTWSNRLTLISLVLNTSRECCLDNLEASSGDHQSISTTTVKGLNIRTQVPTDISTLIRGVLLSDCEDVPSPAPPSTCHSRSKRLFAHTAGVFFLSFLLFVLLSSFTVCCSAEELKMGTGFDSPYLAYSLTLDLFSKLSDSFWHGNSGSCWL